MLKSIRLSLAFFGEIVGGTVSPPFLIRKTILAANKRRRRRPAGIRGVPRAAHALTFPDLER
jgi:hypothetical protein